MKIAVTGASGLVGGYIVKKVLEEGHQAHAIDVIEPEDRTDQVPFTQADLTEYDEVLKVFSGSDAVIHAAALPVAHNLPDAKVHNVNVTCSYNVLRACAELGIKRVTQLSSINAIGSVYTPYLRKYHYLPFDEQSPYEPADPYALSKMICEFQAESLVRTFPKMRIASIRPHACLPNRPKGPEDDPAIAKYGRSPDYYVDLNVNDCWGWVLMDAVTRACLLGITSEGWSGAEAFYIVAPTTKIQEEQGDKEPSSLELAKKYHPQAKLRAGWFEESRGRGFYDTSKAERMLGWKHDL